MKKAILLSILTILLVFSSNSFAQPAEVIGVKPGNAYIPAGTNIAVELNQTISSKKTFVGEVLEISILEDIVMEDTVVIEKGSTGYIKVTEVRQPAEWGQAGGIVIQPQYVKTTNWIKVPLTKGIEKNGKGHPVLRTWGAGAAGVAGTLAHNASGLTGGLSGLLLLYVDPRPGKAAEIPAETKFIVSVDGNVDLQVTPEKLREAMTNDPNRRATSKQNWIGTYSTSRGKLTLHQANNKVTGTYARGKGTVEGRIEGSKLVGTWTEEKSEYAPTGKGFFEMTMSTTGTAIMLIWRNDYSPNWIEDRWANRLSGW